MSANNISKARQPRFWNKWALAGAVSIQPKRVDSRIATALLQVHMDGVRKGWTKVHMPSLGPYTNENPQVCLHCGKAGNTWKSISEQCFATA